jgi:hypothetical protein
MDDETFDRMFDGVLEELNIRNDAVRNGMLAYPKERKAVLLVQNYRNAVMEHAQQQSGALTSINTSAVSNTVQVASSGSGSSAGALFSALLSPVMKTNAERPPEFYIEKLSARNTPRKTLLKLLGALRVTLSTAKLSWIRQFVDNGRGIAVMAGVLDRSLTQTHGGANSDMDEDIRAECIKSFRILLNTEPGFMTVLSSQMVVSKIAFCLYTTNDRLRTTVAEVLAAICVISHEAGQKMVLTAFGDFRGFYNERFRFEYLVESLITTDPLLSTVGGTFSDGRNPVAAFEYKTTVMSLLNALVTTPEALEQRMQLRNELQQRGLGTVQLQKLRKDAPAALLTQIDLYEDEMAEDVKEAEALIKANKFDLGYVSEFITVNGMCSMHFFYF